TQRNDLGRDGPGLYAQEARTPTAPVALGLLLPKHGMNSSLNLGLAVIAASATLAKHRPVSACSKERPFRSEGPGGITGALCRIRCEVNRRATGIKEI